MKTTVIIVGTALAVGFSFTAWLVNLNYLDYGYANLDYNVFLFLFGMITAMGISTVIIGRDIGN
jgi:uncharacterized protein involved in cysteine biosynthesis